MKQKNDYSCIVFFAEDKPKKWIYVHKLSGFIIFLNSKFPNWNYINVYERRTSKYLKRFYPGDVAPDFLSIIIFIVVSLYAIFQPLNSTFSPTPLTFNNGFNNPATISTPIISKGGMYANS